MWVVGSPAGSEVCVGDHIFSVKSVGGAIGGGLSLRPLPLLLELQLERKGIENMF